MTANNWDIVRKMFHPDKVVQLKELFAKLMAKYNEDTDLVLNDFEFVQAMQGSIACRLYAINNWTFDHEVKNLINQYKTKKLDEILPSELEVAQMYYDLYKKSMSPKDKILALDKYREARGFSKSTDSQQTTATQNVLLLRDNGSEMEWNEKLSANQVNLIQKAQELLDKHNETKH